MDMYDAIRSDEPSLPQDENPAFVDLMQKILNKDPEQRITMDKLRVRQSNLSSTYIVDVDIQTGTSLGHQARHG
jgi:serine/threonine protein kinase